MPTFLNSHKGVHNPQKKENRNIAEVQKEYRDILKLIELADPKDEKGLKY